MPEKNYKYDNFEDEPSTTKYMIYADFIIDGLVEKPDVVGALFGQTEGLLTDDLELRELQKSGRVGRIQVYLNIRGGKTKGTIKIPSSLDKVETSILAAAIETVDRIGPCGAEIVIKKIEDIRREKMKKIKDRASELLQKWNSEATQESSELADEVSKAARLTGISHFGKLPAGPEYNESDTIIIVEGRADIAACLRAGVRNTVAVQGASVPKSIISLTERKNTIAFLDGDRGGDLILKELLMYSSVDYVARAPVGKEVEDLKPNEIMEHLSKKVPIEKLAFVTEIHATEILAKAVKRKAAKKVAAPRQPSVHKGSSVPAKTRAPVQSGKVDPTRKPATQTRRPTPQTKEPYQSTRRPSGRPPQSRGRPAYRDSQRRPSSRDRGSRAPYRKEIPKVPEELMPIVKEIDGKEKQEGIFLDEKLKHLKKVAVEKIYEELKKAKGVTKVVFDGVITQRLIDVCDEKKINTIVGARISEIKRRPSTVRYYTFPY